MKTVKYFTLATITCLIMVSCGKNDKDEPDIDASKLWGVWKADSNHYVTYKGDKKVDEGDDDAVFLMVSFDDDGLATVVADDEENIQYNYSISGNTIKLSKTKNGSVAEQYNVKSITSTELIAENEQTIQKEDGSYRQVNSYTFHHPELE